MADKGDVAFTITGDDKDIKDAFDRVKAQAATAAGGVTSAFGNLGKVFESIGTKIAALGAVLAGGAAFKKAIDDSVKFTEESIKLGRTLGSNLATAGGWMAALNDVNSSVEEFDGAAKGLTKNLRENEAELNRLGVATRDSKGNLLDMSAVMQNAIGTVNQFKEGTDRNIAAQQVFGKGVQGNSNFLKVNSDVLAENARLSSELGAVVTQELLTAYKEYDAANDKMQLAFSGIKNTIANALMPVLAQLQEWFVDIAPGAIVVIRGALGGLMAAFWALRNGVVVVWETIKAMALSAVEPILRIGAALNRLAFGDFKGARAEIEAMGTSIGTIWGNAMDSMAASSQKTRDKIADLFSPGTGAAKELDTGTRAARVKKEGAAKAEKERDPSFMQTYELGLQMRKQAYEKENEMREFNKEQELAYWKELLATYDVTSKDRTGIALKTAKLEIEIARDAAKQRAEIDLARGEDRQKAELAYIDELEANARQQRDFGLINNGQLLEQQRAFNAQRYAAEAEFLAQKLELLKLDPDRNLVEIEKLELAKLELRRKYAAINAETARKEAADSAAPWLSVVDQITAGLGKVGQSMLTSWRKVGATLVGVLRDIGNSIIQETILKPLQAKFAAWAKERVLSMAGIGANAAEAGSGAAASQASIPIIGPYLALAAMAAVFAGVIAMQGKVPSAAGGFNIPSGLNPITQLHEQEMVLPADIANPLRDSIAGGGGGLGGGTTIVIQAADARSFADMLDRNPDALASMVKKLKSRGYV